MIHRAVQHIVAELGDYLSLRSGSIESEPVVPGSIVEQGGSANGSVLDKVVVTVVNVEEDRLSRPTERTAMQENGTYRVSNPEVRLNLYLLFIANHSSYDEALKALSYVVAFFQHRNYFDHTNTPSLDTGIEKLVFELFSTTFEQQSYLWGAVGAKYVPSVLYKTRLVAIRDEAIDGEIPALRELDYGLSGAGSGS